MFDWIIQNGTILDGTGGEPYTADVAILGGKIAAIGHRLGVAAHTLDAAGKTVTPGFIDIHRHADSAVFRPGFGELELRQGLTTIINGNCGLSLAPVEGPYRQAVLDYLLPVTGPVDEAVPIASMADYLTGTEGLPIHTGMLVGLGTIRASVAGYFQERLDREQVREIQRILLRSLEEGAVGVSLGLGYAPDCFCTTDELAELLEPLRGTDVPVTVHMREEGDKVCEALAEMLEIARRVDVPVHISHLKAIGRRNWNNKIPRAIEMLDSARDQGLDITCDAHIYTAGSTQLIHILPPDYLVGGVEGITRRLSDPAKRAELAERILHGTDFDNIAGLVGWEGIYCSTLNRPENRPYVGKNFVEIASAMGKDPFTCACDILVSERCAVTMIDFISDEADILRILNLPYSAVISDGTYPVNGKMHPRVCGTCAHVIEKFVLHDHALTLPQAVASMTGIPARALRLPGKGFLAPGMDADLCVFDPANIHEHATYDEPERMSTGMDWVFVSGTPAIAEGQLTDTRTGKSVRREAGRIFAPPCG